MKVPIGIVGVTYDDTVIIDAGRDSCDVALQKWYPMPPVLLAPPEGRGVIAVWIVRSSGKSDHLAELVNHHRGVPPRSRSSIRVRHLDRDAVLPQHCVPCRIKSHRVLAVAGDTDDLSE